MRPERDFCLWLDQRDADALGRVFDAMGGKLLLLAAHLAGPGQQAQDLVQSAFLAAMARGATWDRERPLWPWLATILHNELRMQIRSGRRRREVAIEDAATGDSRVAADDGADPASLVASQEVLTTVLAAVDALPLPYRQVLRLRLVHGLRPVDIARSLEVPVGTVRAQLHRGLEQLRGALPAGVAGLAGLVLSGEGMVLAQVREHVLASVGGKATAAVAGSSQVLRVGGMLAMNAKTMTALVAALVVLACLAIAVGVPNWFAPGATPTVALDPVRVDAPVVAGEGGVVASADPERKVVDEAAVPTWPLTVTVTSDNGKPVAGVTVQVWTAPNSFAFWNRHESSYLREDVAAGETAGDGVFRSSLDDLRSQSDLNLLGQRLWVEASWPHGPSQNEMIALPKRHGAQDVAVSIELRRSAGITGRVVDAAGNAVARATIGTVQQDRYHSGTQSDRDGAFFTEFHRTADYWPTKLCVVHPRLGSVTVPVPPSKEQGVPVDLGDVVLVPRQLVRGVVQLRDGSAVAGVQVGLREIDPSLGDDRQAIRKWLMAEGRKNVGAVLREGELVVRDMQTNSEADGSFQFAGLDPSCTYIVQLRLAKGSADAIVHPGDELVRLQVDGQLVTVEVVDVHGDAVTGVDLNCEGYDPERKHASWVKRPGFPETGMVCSNWPCYGDPAGRQVMLSPFGFIWRIGTKDDSLQPTFARHEAFAGVYRATCRLVVQAQSEFGTLHIVAVDEHGEPIRFGAALKAVVGDLQHNNKRMISPPEGKTWDLPPGQWQVRTVLGKELVYIDTNEGFARGYQDNVVTIEHGRTTQLKVVAKPAGLVAFRLRSTVLPKDAWRGLRIEAAGREVALHAKRHRPWQFDAKNSHLPELFLTKQALAPGMHRFFVQVDGYHAKVCEVDVVSDQLSTVNVDLVPR